ncbi:MAG: cyanophycin synthetase, partial [Herbaspirillum sp.]
ALALCRSIGLPLAPLLHGVRDYVGEPHRIELIATIDDVGFFDDSKGTNVGATVAALNGLGEDLVADARILLLAGGDGKGQDFSPLLAPVQRYVRAVFLIGRDAGVIRTALLASNIPLIDCASLEQAVESAVGLASAGDVVLLSPACASLDMFRNYEHRSQVFVGAVQERQLARGGVPL